MKLKALFICTLATTFALSGYATPQEESKDNDKLVVGMEWSRLYQSLL